jgi:hypothetical protein
MDNSVSITFGTPEHGWLPVDIQHENFKLSFDASNVLNDPMSELFEFLHDDLNSKKFGEVTWWMEPGAYFFNFEKTDSHCSLIISETYDLHPDEGAVEREVIKTCTGDFSQIFEPFIFAVKQFYSKSYRDRDWWQLNQLKTLMKRHKDGN